MTIRVVENYKDKLLDKEMKVGDIYDVVEARGRKILATGWAVEVLDVPTPEETIEEEVKEEIKEDKPKRKNNKKSKKGE